MPTFTTRDGTELFYRDWGGGRPVVFSHGWPLSGDAFEDQMFYLANRGYRCIAHDRRGHGRSSHPLNGNDMDTYADDLAELCEHLELKDAVHVGHSTGGGEVVHYLARHGEDRAAKAALLCAVPPLMVKTDANPEGLPKEVFDDLQAQLAANRSVFYRALPEGPFYGFNRPGAVPSEAMIANWWLNWSPGLAAKSSRAACPPIRSKSPIARACCRGWPTNPIVSSPTPLPH